MGGLAPSGRHLAPDIDPKASHHTREYFETVVDRQAQLLEQRSMDTPNLMVLIIFCDQEASVLSCGRPSLAMSAPDVGLDVASPLLFL